MLDRVYQKARLFADGSIEIFIEPEYDGDRFTHKGP
jgi:hypothetical protein